MEEIIKKIERKAKVKKLWSEELKKLKREFDGVDISDKGIGIKIEQFVEWIKYHREKRKQWGRDFWQRNKKRLNKTRKKDRRVLKCDYCEVEFDTARPNQRFCSEKCQHRWHYERKDKISLPIKQKAELKVFRKMAEKKGHRYTKKEIQYIKKHYKKQTAKEIALELKRPLGGVKWKIRQFKKDDELNKMYGSW